ncbi:hypothetical protein ACFXAW_21860 [Streptomyces sp. NPDC059445]|uniref:hypothetical protein n=1 Tax=Streptomyces sp. NPDC059445 TaxID=3346832 RepID=UPI003687A79D
MPDSIAHAVQAAHPARRLIAAGLTFRAPGRTITVRVTAAGVTGSSIRKAGAR